MPDDDEVLFRRSGACGVVTLNRPRALNALSQAMLEALRERLAACRDDPAIAAVVLESAASGAFSVGADVRTARSNLLAGEHEAVVRYFATEYALDAEIAAFAKPCVAVVDGMAFGGGMALAVHASHCLVTESALFAMPEALIGFFPDAGASHFLPQLDGALGLYLGLTGARLTGPDAVNLGLASHYVPRERLTAARDRLLEEGPACLDGLAVAPPALSFAQELEAIERCFQAESVDDIRARLRTEDSEWSRATLATLDRMSPASLRWTVELFRNNRGRPLETCLEAELELVRESTAHPDFAEGVRAALVDKDRAPRWVGTG